MLAEEVVSGSEFDASRVIIKALHSHSSSSFVSRLCSTKFIKRQNLKIKTIFHDMNIIVPVLLFELNS